MSESGSATAAASSPLVPAGDKDKDKDKVVVLFKATGDAPILKQQKFKINGSERFSKVVDFLRKQLQRESVFVYLRSAFVPCLDDTVASLFSAFGEEGKLVVHYANTPAWG